MKIQNQRTVIAVAVSSLLTTLTVLVGERPFAQERHNAPSRYTFESIDGPVTTFATVLSGINAQGEIAGYQFAPTAPTSRAFLLDKDTFTFIDIAGAHEIATGINESGQIVGYFFEGGFCEPLIVCDVHGFVWDQGTFTSIDVPGATDTEAHGVNSRGQIVGRQIVATPPLPSRAIGFLLDGGTFVDIESPGSDTQATGINNRGQIVGVYGNSPFSMDHGFLLENGTFTSIDVPGSSVRRLTGINERGQIVGCTSNRGFVLQNDTFTMVDFPGATFTCVEDINDRGQLVGYYTGGGAPGLHGFVATPCRGRCQ